ncbi:MAG: hypothetical protein JNM27_08665 [Leptospirales bacterium]|nr:hypothetical protein [Leptospirales bacterium]
MSILLCEAVSSIRRAFPVTDDTGRQAEEYFQLRPEFLEDYGFSLDRGDDHYLSTARTRRFSSTNTNVAQQAIQPLDIVMQIIGNEIGRVGLVTPDLDARWIAPPTFAILRVNLPRENMDEILPLYYYFRRPETRKLLRESANKLGAAWVLPVKTLRNIKVPRFEREFIKRAREAFEKQGHLRKEISRMEKTLMGLDAKLTHFI